MAFSISSFIAANSSNGIVIVSKSSKDISVRFAGLDVGRKWEEDDLTLAAKLRQLRH